MLKATAGGGGMGLVVCQDEAELMRKFISTQERAKVSVPIDSQAFIEEMPVSLP